MAGLDWVLVMFGVLLASAGAWIQLRPETIYPRLAAGEAMEERALELLRRLGGCFHGMGVFFTLQMAADLAHQPWWLGAALGVLVAVLSVRMIGGHALLRLGRRRAVRQGGLPKKTLEVR